MRARALIAAVALFALAALTGCGRAATTRTSPPAQVSPTHATSDAGPDSEMNVATVGLVHGRYEIEGGPISLGGPANGQVHPISGQVTFERGGRPVKTVPVGPDGEFSVQLPPGTYQVTASTPDVTGPAGSSSGCALLQSVTVTNGGSSAVTVYCPVP